MSNSSNPIDSAMNLIKSDRGLEIAESGDNLEKIAPLALAVPALFAAYGAARSQGMHGLDAIGDDEKDFFGFDPNMVRYEDPILGMTWGTTDDPNLGHRALGFGLGAMQGLNPFSYGRAALRGGGAAARAAGPQVARLGRAFTPSAGRTTPGAPRFLTGMQRLEDTVASAPGRAVQKVGHRMGASQMGRQWVPVTDEFGNVVRTADGVPKMKLVDKDIMDVGKVRGALGRVAQRSGPLALSWFANQLADDWDVPTSGDFGAAGYGGQSSGFGFGDPQGDFEFGQGHGMGDLATGYSQGGPNFAVYEGEKAAQGHYGQEMKEFEERPEYGDIRLGENMSLGDDLLNKAKENMYKEKEEKKPKKGGAALILVMGHGKPGPSTEGKPDKLDSEKAE